MSVDQRTLEKQAGQKAALRLRKSLRKEIRSLFETSQGNSELLKASVAHKMKGPELQRLVLKGPYYMFMQHFGFEGVKSNGVKMSLLSNSNFLNDVTNGDNVLQDLATEIGEIRMDEVISKINF